MQQLIDLWLNLNIKRKLVVIVSSFAMFAAILGMARMASAPTMTLLYSGLESGPAGEVVRALEQRGAVYDVRGGSIFVDSKLRDELRMTLASEGLPANSTGGYELLDTLTGFGTTSQMFDAAYWRAKEGELARTIVASPRISSARVHISNAGSNPFQRDIQPTASVSIIPVGGTVSSRQAKAMRFLVASAVAGLSPDDVAVIDGNGNLIGATEDTSAGADDQSKTLRDRVQRIVDASVGVGNAVVEVSVETVTETESIKERSFDPDSRVAISTDTEERTNSSQDAAGGDVTVASNLPDQDGAGGAGSTAQNSETRERVNYEVSETERQIVRAAGAVKRLSVAVLVNGNVQTDDTGTEVFEPRPEAELAALRELVSSAVGFNEARGDVITIKSMAIQAIEPQGTAATTSLIDRADINLMSAIQMGILALVTLILGLFVVKPVLSRPAKQEDVISLPPADPGSSDLPALNGEIADDLGSAMGGDMGMADFGAADFGMMDSPSNDPVDRLRGLIEERQDETVEVLRGWLEEPEETS